MRPITICFTYFKSLSLMGLEAALYSVRRQDLSNVEQIIVVDNDTLDAPQAIQRALDAQDFPVPVRLLSSKHGDPSKTHSWSTNLAVGAARTPWVLFTRADYILEFDLVRRFTEIAGAGDSFITGHVYHLLPDITACEATTWRVSGAQVLRALQGVEETYTHIDTGVWMTSKTAFDNVGGLDESLTVWGHAQTHFQYKLFRAGVKFVRIPEILFYHPAHCAPRDITLAHAELREHGVDIRELWARWEGVQPY